MTLRKLVLCIFVALNIVQGHCYSISPQDVPEKHPEDCQCDYCQVNERYDMPLIESRISDQKPYASHENASVDEDQYSIPTYFFDKPAGASKMAKEKKKMDAEIFKYADLSSEDILSNNTSEQSCPQGVDVVTPESLSDVFASLEAGTHSTVSRESVMKIPFVTDGEVPEGSGLPVDEEDLGNVAVDEKVYEKVTAKEELENVAPKPKTQENHNKPTERQDSKVLKGFLKTSPEPVTVTETNTPNVLTKEQKNPNDIKETGEKQKIGNKEKKMTHVNKTVKEGESKKEESSEDMKDQLEKMFNDLLATL